MTPERLRLLISPAPPPHGELEKPAADPSVTAPAAKEKSSGRGGKAGGKQADEEKASGRGGKAGGKQAESGAGGKDAVAPGVQKLLNLLGVPDMEEEPVEKLGDPVLWLKSLEDALKASDARLMRRIMLVNNCTCHGRDV